MPAELLAHGGQDLFGEGVVLARAEAGVERGGQHLGRDGLLDCRLDRLAALAGILDVTGEFLEVRILGERDRGQIEEPG